MPVITPQERPIITATTEDAFRYPKKIITQSTGMDISKSFSGAPVEQVEEAPKDRQLDTSAETNTPKEVTLSPQLTALARKEAKIRQQEQALKADREAIAAERLEIAELRELKTKLAAKDYSGIENLVQYDEYTNYLLNKAEGNRPETEAIKKLEDEIKAIKTTQETTVTKQYEATIAQYERDIKNAVESNPEYSSIKERNAEKHVLQHILDTFNEEGEVLTVDQAAKEIEEFILEEALAMQKLSKVQKQTAPKIEEKRLPPPKSGLRTLTNQVVQGSSSTPKNQFQHLSMKERIVEAAKRSQR